MSVQYIMPNGDVVPLPQDVAAQGPAACQAFYDNQLERVKVEAEDIRPSPAPEE